MPSSLLPLSRGWLAPANTRSWNCDNTLSFKKSPHCLPNPSSASKTVFFPVVVEKKWVLFLSDFFWGGLSLPLTREMSEGRWKKWFHPSALSLFSCFQEHVLGVTYHNIGDLKGSIPGRPLQQEYLFTKDTNLKVSAQLPCALPSNCLLFLEPFGVELMNSVTLFFFVFLSFIRLKTECFLESITAHPEDREFPCIPLSWK